MKSSQFYVVHGWMVSGLNLKGNELIAYAAIYGFTQNGEEYKGSISYLQDLMSVASDKTVRNVLASLVERGLLYKESFDYPSGRRCVYKANLDVVASAIYELSQKEIADTLGKNYRGGTVKFTEGVGKNYRGGTVKFTDNNKDNNKYGNIDNIDCFLVEKEKVSAETTDPEFKMNSHNNITDNYSITSVKSKVDYEHFADFWNSNCISRPKCTVMSDKRKVAIKACLNKFTTEQIEEAILKVESAAHPAMHYVKLR